MISSAKECRVKLLSCVRLFATPRTIAYHTPPSMGFSRREPWSGLPFPSQRIFLTQGSNLGLPHCKQMLYRLSYQGSPKGCIEQANILGDEFKHIMILMVSINTFLNELETRYNQMSQALTNFSSRQHRILIYVHSSTHQ